MAKSKKTKTKWRKPPHYKIRQIARDGRYAAEQAVEIFKKFDSVPANDRYSDEDLNEALRLLMRSEEIKNAAFELVEVCDVIEPEEAAA